MATQIGQLKYSVGFDVKKQDLNSLKASLQQIKKLSISDLMKINQSDRNTAIQTFSQIRTQAENVEKAIKEAFNVKLNTVNIETFNKSLKQSDSSIQQIYKTFKQAGTAGQNAFRGLSSQVLTTNVQLKQTHKFLDNIATTLANTIKWNIASSAVNTLSNSVQQAWGYVKSLDTSLNDIRIVTGKSADEMANFAVQANEAAKSLGKTTVDYTKAALIYAQQGLNDEQIAARAAITLKAANVTGQSTDQVSEQLTSVWNGYKVNAEQAELYIDRLAAVAASTASDLEELSTGMSKVAAAAAAMGVGEDQLAAQLSTIISVTRQAPESVGTALRTVYARISDIKAGIDEDGVDLGRYSGKMAELGFNVLDVNGKLRDMGQVIEEIGGRWQNLTREQQVSLAQTMAGQRQYSNLIALFDNFQEYNKTLSIAQNAAGTLQKQQDTYMESTRAHLNQLKAATEDLYDSLINPDSLEPLIDGLSTVATATANFVDAIGGGHSVLAALGAIGVSVFSNQIANSLNTTITNFEIAKRNAQQFDNVLQTIQQWKGIEGLDQTTRSLLENREQILNLSKLMTPEQFSGMQDLLNEITETGNKLSSIKDQKGLFDSQLKEIGNIKEEWKDFNNVLKDAEAQSAIEKNLQNQEDEFTNASKALKEYGQNFRQVFGNQSHSIEDINNLKNSINDYLKRLQELSTTNGNFKNHAQQISNLRKEFNNLSNIPESQLPRKLNEITASMSGLYTNGANAAQQLREKLIEEFAETARSLGYSQKEIEDKLNKLVKAFENAGQQIKRTFDIKSFSDLIGGISRLGVSIQQIQNLGGIWKNENLDNGEKILQTVTNLGVSLPMLVTGAKSAAVALQAMGVASTFATGGLTAIIAGITAVIGLTISLAKGASEANKALIKLRESQIEEQNKKQEQIQNNKKLYSSIEDLNKKYKQGQITRIELKSSVEDLIDQYGIEGQSIRALAGDYDTLTESIKQKRIEAARQGRDSAREEATSARDLISRTAKEGLGFQLGNEYKLRLSGGLSEEDELGNILKYLREAGGFYNSDNNIYFRTDFDADSIIDLYDKINKAIIKIQNDVSISDKERQNSEFYQNAIKWRDKMTASIEKQKKALEDIAKYQNELNILTSSFDIQNIKTANEYLEQRNKIIEVLKKNNTEQQAKILADTYLRDNYRQLFVQFDEGSKYIDKIKDKFADAGSQVGDIISKLDVDHIGWLVDFVNIDSIDQWEDLKKIIQEISNLDLSNVNPLTSKQEVLNSKEKASNQYTFLQSLEDQIQSGKSISSKQFKDLAENGFPELQQYFTMLANGQYKMTKDAQSFYNEINSLKLSGFYDSIQQINNEIERTNAIIKNDINFDKLDDVAYHMSDYAVDFRGNRLQGASAEKAVKRGVASSQIIIDQNLAQKQIDALREIRAYDNEYTKRLEQWQRDLNSSNISLEKKKDITLQLANDINEEIKKGHMSLDDLGQQLVEMDKQIYDAMFPTDKDIDESALAGLTSVIQGLSEQSEQLHDSLNQDKRAAEAVAEAILRFDNAIEDVVKNYDTWIDVLNDEKSSLQQIAQIIEPLRDAYADLLDINGSSLSDEFLQSQKNLQLMKQAIDGNIQAYEQLRLNVANDLIAHITFDTESDEQHFVSRYKQIQNQLNDWFKDPINIKIGAELDPAIQSSLQGLINDAKMTADQARDFLQQAFGINAEVINETKPVTEEQQYTGFTSNIGLKEIKTASPLMSTPGTYIIPDIDYTPVSNKVTNKKMVTGTALKVITAKKAVGGNIKWKNSSQGGGAAGTTRRAEAAKKAESKIKTTTKQIKSTKKDDRDIYHDINIQLDQVSKSLSKVQKQQSRLYGKQLINNLNKQTQILEQHKVKLTEKNELQKLDLQRKKQQLANLGVIFNQYDHIGNYLDILGNKQGNINGLIAQYNTIVEQFNAATDKETQDAINEQLTALDRQIKNAQTDYKDLETLVKNYDSLRKSIADVADQIEEETQKQIEIRISKFRMKVEISLDMGEIEREWNEFEREIREGNDLFNDSAFNTLFKDAAHSLRDATTYFKQMNGQSIKELTDSINTQLKQLNQLKEQGQASIYSDHAKQLMDHIKSDFSTLAGQMKEVAALKNQVDQAYFDTIDDVNNQFDKQIEQYEFVSDRLQHDMDLLQLVYGDKAYDAMDSYYNQLIANDNKTLDSLKQQAAFYKEMWDNAIGEQDAKKFEELWRETISQLDGQLQKAIQHAQDQYINAINKIYYQLDMRLTSGRGLDYVQMEWQLINKNADEYLDTINSAFALQDLESKFRKAIDGTDSVKNQKALTDLMDQQLGYLRDKNKLTEYDVERAEKLLGIEQARMALEDTRNAKTSLRLKRDSQGNYSYVYAANEDDIDDAEDKLAKLQNDLYNFDKQAYRNNFDDMLSAYKDYLSKEQEILIKYKDDEEARQKALTLLRQQYGEYINGKTQQNIYIRKNLANSAAADYIALYNENSLNFKEAMDENYSNFDQLTQKMKYDLSEELVPNWNNSVQQMMNTFVAEGGFAPACKTAWDEIDQKTSDYKGTVNDLAASAGADLGELKTGVDSVTTAYSKLIEQNDKLITKMQKQMDKISDLKRELDGLLGVYQDVWKAADQAVEAAKNAWLEYEKAMKEALGAEPPQTGDIGPREQHLPTVPTINPNSNRENSTGNDLINPDQAITGKIYHQSQPYENKEALDFARGLAGAIYYRTWGDDPKDASIIGAMVKRVMNEAEIKTINGKTIDWIYNQAQGLVNQNYDNPSFWGKAKEYKQYFPWAFVPKQQWDMIKKMFNFNGNRLLPSLDTGGYTGEWGPEGRLAMLHQKQLVLNAADTKNILNSVSIIRDMVTGLNGDIFSRLSKINSGYGNINPFTSNGQLDQNVNIQASFPNVNSKREIEEAFSELVNMAAQRAMKRI